MEKKQQEVVDDLGNPETGPKQVNHQFLLARFGFQKRAFQKTWYSHFEWLDYSINQNAVFCFTCRLYGKQQHTQQNMDSLISTGFSKWKRALDTFRDHEKSFKASHTQGDFIEQLQAAGIGELTERREYLRCIVAVTTFLGKQGVPLRGHNGTEESLNQGNFIECVKLLKQFDPKLYCTITCHLPVSIFPK